MVFKNKKIQFNTNDSEQIKLKGYLAEIDRFKVVIEEIFENICDFALIIVPVLIFILCITKNLKMIISY